jgi:hypothetical protein
VTAISRCRRRDVLPASTRAARELEGGAETSRTNVWRRSSTGRLAPGELLDVKSRPSS